MSVASLSLSRSLNAAVRKLHLVVMSFISLLLVGGSLTALNLVTMPPAAASAPPSPVGAGPNTSGASRIGPLAANTELSVLVTLQPRNPAALARFATAVSTPGNRLYRHFLARGQFPSMFGPTRAAISAVESDLRASGLHPGAINATHLFIPVTATARQLTKAFSTSFAQYRVGTRTAYANTSAPKFAASVTSYVQGVIGLDDLHPLQHVGLAHATHITHRLSAPHVVTGGPQPCSSAVTAGEDYDSYTADQLASAYRFSSLYGASDFGSGQTIGLFELEPNSPSDISTFQTCYGTSATVNYISVDGGAGTGTGMGEAALDIEDVISLSPESTVDVYQAPSSDTGAEEDYATIESADAAKSISSSWGKCEADIGSSMLSAENTDFEDMSAQGQSMFAAAGDSGSEGCTGSDRSLAVDDPASQPYVTGVGGTTMSALGPPPTEVVWNQGPGGAGGGGISTEWPMQSYQSGAPSALNVINSNSSKTPCSSSTVDCREVPDVTADANPYTGYVIYFSGPIGDIGCTGWCGVGGTSAASPLWAALMALIDASSSCDGTPVGFANPELYAAAASSTGYTQDFQDITSGNNDYDGSNGGLFPAGTYYDMASGLGSPDGEYLPAALCAGSTPTPTITSVSPVSGPSTGSTSVTITGTNLAGATAVTFGGTAGTVTSDTANSIVVETPAGSAGAVAVAVTTAGATATDSGAFSYYVPGFLRVTTSPAVPSQITVDGNVADTWGLTWAKEAPGSDTVCFSDVEGYTTPSCQTVTVTAGATTTVTGTFVQRGFLQVTTSPAVPAEITYERSPSTTPIPMDDYGAWTDLPVGSYTVCFGAVAGYTPPICQFVSVTAGETTSVTGDYSVNAGATGQSNVGLLRVTTSPAVPSQITVDGNIADTWGLNWLELASGSHTVCFSDVQGYATPACQTVTLTAGATTTVTGTFVQGGFLQVETSPAVAGTISINGVPADDWGVYTDLPTGSYTVCFGAVSGDPTPACQSASVPPGATTTVTGTY